MSNDRKKTMSDIFGDSDDDEGDESFKLAPTTTATPGSTAKATTAADTSGLFGSDSSSEDEHLDDSDDDDDDDSDEDYSTTLKKKTSKKRKSTGSTSSRKKTKTGGGKLKRGQPTTKRRMLKDDDSDDSDAETTAKSKPVATKIRNQLNSGDEYDSGEDIERNKEDDDFIDGEDDLAHVLGEYDGDVQQFRDERPDDSDQMLRRGRGQDDDEEEDNFFDQTMKSLKTSKRRGKIQLSPVELEQMAQEILYRMDTAFSNDLQTIAEGKPGLEKIKFLSTATSILSKVQFQPTLLDFNLLEILKKWIQPHESSGQLPNVGIRSKLLHITKRLPIYKDHLKRSGFGKVIMVLWKHPDETLENKDICRELIERWSRSVFDKTLDYRKLAELEAEKKGSLDTSVNTYRSVRNHRNSQNSSQTKQSNMLRDSSKGVATISSEAGGTRVRIPQGIRMDFVHRPQPKDDARKSELTSSSSRSGQGGPSGDSKKQKLARRMQNIARPARKNVRAITMSVEGRGS